MSSVLDLLYSQLGSGGIETISRQLGIDPQTAQKAVAGAIPILTGAMARNASNPAGADALHRALQQHDGSILDQAIDYLGGGDTSAGAGILGHILGGGQDHAATNLAKATGLDSGTAIRLLMMLAPLVMGALGRTRQQQGLDPGDLAGMIRAEHEQAQSAVPASVLGGLSSLLDTNHDGSMVDDVARIGGGLLGDLFGNK
jgi:hypothetical protein